MIDYHIHTKRCRHARGEMAEYVVEAEMKKLAEIGFADHFPLDLLGYTPQEQVTMESNELSGYFREIAELRHIAPFPVRAGLEVDYIPGREKQAAAALAGLELDYVIGSVHFLGDWDFTHPRFADHYHKIDVGEVYERYFQTVEDLAKSGLFDIVGHLDVVKKFAHYPSVPWDHLVEKVCRTLKKYGLCVELNTAGWRAPAREAYPGVSILEHVRDLGIPVTLGSDAHCPEDVGYKFREAVYLLKKLGIKEIATFSKRSMKMHSINNLIE